MENMTGRLERMKDGQDGPENGSLKDNTVLVGRSRPRERDEI